MRALRTKPIVVISALLLLSWNLVDHVSAFPLPDVSLTAEKVAQAGQPRSAYLSRALYHDDQDVIAKELDKRMFYPFFFTWSGTSNLRRATDRMSDTASGSATTADATGAVSVRSIDRFRKRFFYPLQLCEPLGTGFRKRSTEIGIVDMRRSSDDKHGHDTGGAHPFDGRLLIFGLDVNAGLDRRGRSSRFVAPSHLSGSKHGMMAVAKRIVGRYRDTASFNIRSRLERTKAGHLQRRIVWSQDAERWPDRKKGKTTPPPPGFDKPKKVAEVLRRPVQKRDPPTVPSRKESLVERMSRRWFECFFGFGERRDGWRIRHRGKLSHSPVSAMGDQEKRNTVKAKHQAFR